MVTGVGMTYHYLICHGVTEELSLFLGSDGLSAKLTAKHFTLLCPSAQKQLPVATISIWNKCDWLIWCLKKCNVKVEWQHFHLKRISLQSLIYVFGLEAKNGGLGEWKHCKGTLLECVVITATTLITAIITMGKNETQLTNLEILLLQTN